MKSRIAAMAAVVLAAGVLALASWSSATAEPGCVYSGGGWICSGQLSPDVILPPETPPAPAVPPAEPAPEPEPIPVPEPPVEPAPAPLPEC